MDAELPFSVKMEREVAVIRAFQAEHTKVTPNWVLRYGSRISDTVEQYPDVSNPDELLHLVKLKMPQ